MRPWRGQHYCRQVSFLDDLRSFLRQPVIVSDAAREEYRRHALATLERCEREGRSRTWLEERIARLDLALALFTSRLTRELAARGVAVDDIPVLVKAGIAARTLRRVWLVECKNWSKPVDRGELDVFVSKLARRFHRASLGFFIAPGGASAGFHSALAAERKGEQLVVFVDHTDLGRLVQSTDRNHTLKELHDRAIVEGHSDER